MARGEPSPGADVAWGEPSPGADVTGAVKGPLPSAAGWVKWAAASAIPTDDPLACAHVVKSQCRCRRGEPSPGADVGRNGPAHTLRRMPVIAAMSMNKADVVMRLIMT